MKKKKKHPRFYIKINFQKLSRAEMELCNLCEIKYSKLFKPEERLLGTQLSSVIRFIYGDSQVDFPPKFLICTACAAALLQTDVVLKRLSKALPGIKRSERDHLNSTSSHIENGEINEDPQADQKDKHLDGEIIGETIKKVPIDWTFHCRHCAFETNKANVYRKHLISEHQVENPRTYECMYCEQTYQRVNAIQNHIATVHDNKARPKPQRRKTIAFDTPSMLSSTTIKSQLENCTPVHKNAIEHNTANDGNLAYEFNCQQCKYKTIRPKTFKKHLLVEHKIEDIRIYKCNRCPITYARQFALQNHIAYKHENKPKPIQQRRKSVSVAIDFESKTEKLPDMQVEQEETDYNDEEVNPNGNISSIKADDEQSEDESIFHTPQQKKRKQNEISTHEWIFHCTPCGFETKKKIKYSAHLSNTHGICDINIYKCPHCSASYERYSLLQSHMTNKHSIELTVLNDTLTLHSDYSQGHIKMHSEKKRKLEESKQVESSQLEQSNKLEASGEETRHKELCVVCGKKCSTVEKLRAHMEKQHGGDETKSNSLKKHETSMFSAKFVDTKLACQYPGCPKRFSKQTKLEKHMREKHADFI